MPTISGNHLHDEKIELYSLGQLTEESVTNLEEHLLLCDSCQVRLGEIEQYLQVASVAATELRQEPIKARGLSWSWLWPMPKPLWAGALAAIAVMAVGVGTYRPAEPVTSQHEVLLQASRGIETDLLARTAPGKLMLSFDATELAPASAYRIQIVSSGGNEIWNATVPAVRGMMHVSVNQTLVSGKYWVRLFGPQGAELLREYGLEVK